MDCVFKHPSQNLLSIQYQLAPSTYRLSRFMLDSHIPNGISVLIHRTQDMSPYLPLPTSF